MTCTPDHLRTAEAIIFVAKAPVTVRTLRLQMPDADVDAVLAELRQVYEGRGFGVAETGGGWVFRTRPECSRLAVEFKEAPLSPQAIETLAAIALWGPLTFAEIERIRERDARAVVITLADRRLIRAGPRREGRVTAMTWVADTRFFEMFDLPGLAALPTWAEARRPELADLSIRPEAEEEVEAPADDPEVPPQEEGHLA
ncbi:SMC-Scp complex subunit ScpB [Methylobacterium sp. 092160098-2]|jgi:segregation and condensation protein B|uniref:SMC-Scp complex subunit ScpB n=1 Tax=Methylobacterium sp. 092160098-2 TaxID=3025129 RepID=UPI002381BFD1|nr:SMC-Scp complex subunit ScpB [Methylobacterium sp. 092160098-2]MDE4914887.1 SMC-Scp complex subunit ScpB [Methylobacterium sp. 092160098-2]